MKKRKKIGVIKSHFLDSGAFTQWTLSLKWYQERKGSGRWDYYDTDEFYQYMDDYAAFVKKYKIAIDLYANVDVIPNPELTLRNQKYLENEHGLKPVPVVHYPTNLKWLKMYMDEGYKIIGLGGLVGSANKLTCKRWIDDCFHMVCDTPDNLPKVKIHGFGLTSFKMLTRYPWWSVDSAAWDKIASYGGINVPHKRYRNGEWKFVFDEAPYLIKISMESPQTKTKSHYLSYRKSKPAHKKLVEEWLDYIDIPLGKLDNKGKVIEKGVVTFHVYRRIANLIFYDKMVKALPKYPWSFIVKKKRSLF